MTGQWEHKQSTELRQRNEQQALGQIQRRYRVPAEMNARIKFERKPGTIVGVNVGDLSLLIELDEQPGVKVPVHPTWDMTYDSENGPAIRVPEFPERAGPFSILGGYNEPQWSGM